MSSRSGRNSPNASGPTPTPPPGTIHLEIHVHPSGKEVGRSTVTIVGEVLDMLVVERHRECRCERHGIIGLEGTLRRVAEASIADQQPEAAGVEIGPVPLRELVLRESDAHRVERAPPGRPLEGETIKTGRSVVFSRLADLIASLTKVRRLRSLKFHRMIAISCARTFCSKRRAILFPNLSSAEFLTVFASYAAARCAYGRRKRAMAPISILIRDGLCTVCLRSLMQAGLRPSCRDRGLPRRPESNAAGSRT